MPQGIGGWPLGSGEGSFTRVGTAALSRVSVTSCKLGLSGDLQTGLQQAPGPWGQWATAVIKAKSSTGWGEGKWMVLIHHPSHF